jgi:hypothetical protein
MRHEFAAMPATFFAIIRPGVNSATQPPRSGEAKFPGSNGSYFAEDE